LDGFVHLNAPLDLGSETFFHCSHLHPQLCHTMLIFFSPLPCPYSHGRIKLFKCPDNGFELVLRGRSQRGGGCLRLLEGRHVDGVAALLLLLLGLEMELTVTISCTSFYLVIFALAGLIIAVSVGDETISAYSSTYKHLRFRRFISSSSCPSSA